MRTWGHLPHNCLYWMVPLLRSFRKAFLSLLHLERTRWGAQVRGTCPTGTWCIQSMGSFTKPQHYVFGKRAWPMHGHARGQNDSIYTDSQTTEHQEELPCLGITLSPVSSCQRVRGVLVLIRWQMCSKRIVCFGSKLVGLSLLSFNFRIILNSCCSSLRKSLTYI